MLIPPSTTTITYANCATSRPFFARFVVFVLGSEADGHFGSDEPSQVGLGAHHSCSQSEILFNVLFMSVLNASVNDIFELIQF